MYPLPMHPNTIRAPEARPANVPVDTRPPAVVRAPGANVRSGARARVSTPYVPFPRTQPPFAGQSRPPAARALSAPPSEYESSETPGIFIDRSNGMRFFIEDGRAFPASSGPAADRGDRPISADRNNARAPGSMPGADLVGQGYDAASAGVRFHPYPRSRAIDSRDFAAAFAAQAQSMPQRRNTGQGLLPTPRQRFEPYATQWRVDLAPAYGREPVAMARPDREPMLWERRRWLDQQIEHGRALDADIHGRQYAVKQHGFVWNRIARAFADAGRTTGRDIEQLRRAANAGDLIAMRHLPAVEAVRPMLQQRWMVARNDAMRLSEDRRVLLQEQDQNAERIQQLVAERLKVDLELDALERWRQWQAPR